MRHARLGLPILCLGLAAFALADGGMFGGPQPYLGVVPPMESGQKAIIIDGGPTEVIVYQVTYRGPRDAFAWVLPVPGKPGPRDIDDGCRSFFDAVERVTSPTVFTNKRIPGLGPVGGTMGGAPGRLGSVQASPTVVELEHLSVGPYKVSVLAATGKGVLGDWLRAHGFRTSPAADHDLDGYVSRGWYFLATRVEPSKSATAAVSQGDLPPLAVRFPRPDKLVYPLAISRSSTGPRCVLDLTVLSRAYVDCEEAPAFTIQAGRAGSGRVWDLYDASTHSGRNSVLLASLPDLRLPVHATCMADTPAGDGTEIGRLYATRLWLRPTKERMVDLHFVPAAGVPNRMEVYREPAGSSSRLAPLGYTYAPSTENGEPSGPAPHPDLGASDIVAFVLLSLACLLAFLLFVLRPRSCAIPAAALLALLALLGAGSSRSTSWHHGEYRRQHSFQGQSSTVYAAINTFHDLTGAFPASIDDLTRAKPPAFGLDASGNQVPIKGVSHWSPPLQHIPDGYVAEGIPGHWLLDLVAPDYVSSSAYELYVWWAARPVPDPSLVPRPGPGIWR